MSRSRFIAGSVVVAVLGAALWTQLPRSHGAFFPQFRRQLRDHLWARVSFGLRDDPSAAAAAAPPAPMARPAVLPGVAAYRSAIAAGKTRPGATAFHADTDLYCEHNRAAVEDQARKEGLTVGEVKELTFFGFAAMRVSQRSKIEETLGHPIDDAKAQKLEEIVQRQNALFTKTMRQQVDDGAGEEQRWATIQDFEQRFVEEFDGELGINADQLDRMLAPDANELAGAMAVALPKNAQPPPEASSTPANAPPRPLTVAAPPGAGPLPPSPAAPSGASPPPGAPVR
jgi:hypothetical protein